MVSSNNYILYARGSGEEAWGVEPWLSSCRAVEAPSRRCRARCRGAVEALPVEPCRACRVPVEPVKADSMRLGVE